MHFLQFFVEWIFLRKMVGRESLGIGYIDLYILLFIYLTMDIKFITQFDILIKLI